MSMPPLFGVDETQQLEYRDAINNLLISIAMEESAMSHVLNAEGEILQYITTDEFIDNLANLDPDGNPLGDPCDFPTIFADLADSLKDLFGSFNTMECALMKKLVVAGQGNADSIIVTVPEDCGARP